jgi:hypothetical protein
MNFQSSGPRGPELVWQGPRARKIVEGIYIYVHIYIGYQVRKKYAQRAYGDTRSAYKKKQQSREKIV